MFEAGFQIRDAGAGGFVGSHEAFDFGGERADLVLEFEHRGAAFGAGAAAEHAFAGQDHSGQGDEGDAGMGRAEAERGGLVRDDEDFFQQAFDDVGNALVGLHPVERPSGGSFRQGLHLGAGGVADECFRNDGGDAELLFCQAADDGFRHRLVLDEHGLEVISKRRLDGAGAGVVGLDERGEHAVNAGLELVRVAEAFEHVLRAFFKSLAALDELADGVETGGALGENLVRIDGGGARGVEVATGVLIGALGDLKSFFQLAEHRAGGFDFSIDAGLLGAEFFEFQREALLLIAELARALTVAFELGERAFDFRLHRGDDRLRAVRLPAGFAQRGLDGFALLAGAFGAGFLVGELDFLLGDDAAELIERLVGCDEFELLLGELLARFGDVLVVLADAGFQLGLALVVEGDPAGGGVQRVAVFVEALAELGEFALENPRGGAGFGDRFFLGGKLHFQLGVADFEAADGNDQFIALGGEFDEFLVTEVAVEHPCIGGERLIAAGLGDLAAQRVHPALLFC